MENLKYGIFDFFVYAVPGAILLFFVFLIKAFDPLHPVMMFDYSLFEKDKSFLLSIAFLFMSYVTGFILSTAGNLLFKLYKLIFIKKVASDVSKNKKYVYVRELLKENYRYIEMWNALKNLSTSLSLLFLFITIFYWVRFENFSWLYKIIGFSIFLLLIVRASIFHRWSEGDLDAAFNNLDDIVSKAKTTKLGDE